MIPDLKTEFAFQIRIDFKERVIMESPRGNRGYVPPTGGWVDGPRLKGKVIAYSGADWAWIRPDGVLELDARYMLEADDGTPIYLQSRGYRWPKTPEIGEKMARNEDVGPDDYYMRVSPKFDVPEGPHDWISKHIFVGVAEKVPHANRIHYFMLL